MGKIAFMFSGQGAQYVGMGRELYQSFDEVRQLFDEANEYLGQDITGLCFEGPAEELNITKNTQPAVLLVSLATVAALEANNVKPDMAAGLSLGEYGALITAGCISFKQGIKLVRKRGLLMQQAVPIGQGTMAAVLGLSKEQVQECCRRSADKGIVEPANYNCSGQIVISGHIDAVEKACQLALEMGAKKAVFLSVSAPFHSSLLIPAGEALALELESVMIKDPLIPVVSNVTAKPETDAQQIRHNLISQVSNPVRWEESIMYMIKQGVDTFIEVGPGRVLNGFLKKISKEVRGYNVEDMKSLDNTLKGLEN